MSSQKVIIGNSLDVIKTIPAESIDVCVTSPPYWGLRDYGVNTIAVWGGDNLNCAHDWEDNSCSKCGAWRGQLGLEPNPMDYIEHLCMIFDEVKRVLKPTGACWVNIGDTYNGNKKGNTDVNKNGKVSTDTFQKQSIDGLKDKSLIQIPSRFAIAMTDRGWILRNECIWHKPNVMPQSCADRFTVDFEKFFFFTKEPTYYFKQQLEPIAEVSLKRAEYGFKSDKGNISGTSSTGINVDKMGTRFANPEGRNCRTVWKIPTSGCKESHIAMFPPALIDKPIQACCPDGGIVLDPFCGSGTTLAYCHDHNIDALGIDINPDNMDIINRKSERFNRSLEQFTEGF